MHQNSVWSLQFHVNSTDCTLFQFYLDQSGQQTPEWIVTILFSLDLLYRQQAIKSTASYWLHINADSLPSLSISNVFISKAQRPCGESVVQRPWGESMVLSLSKAKGNAKSSMVTILTSDYYMLGLPGTHPENSAVRFCAGSTNSPSEEREREGKVSNVYMHVKRPHKCVKNSTVHVKVQWRMNQNTKIIQHELKVSESSKCWSWTLYERRSSPITADSYLTQTCFPPGLNNERQSLSLLQEWISNWEKSQTWRKKKKKKKLLLSDRCITLGLLQQWIKPWQLWKSQMSLFALTVTE